MLRIASAFAVGLIVSTTCLAQQPAPPPTAVAPFAVELDKIQWTKGAEGRDYATLVGDRSKPGLYIQLVRWPAHAINKAHSHPDNRYAVVLKGTFYHGYGDKYDANKLEVRPVGSFFTEPARMRHYGITKDEPVILYFVGMGPSTNDEQEK
jgi:uncharacterized RmlC-like cupin family protein